MPRVKVKRSQPHIDMTAFTDVAFLLLTFFMLATKFKPMEPVEVITPASTSTKTIPLGFMTVTISPDGKVFYDVDNLKVKRGLIEAINDEKGLGLTETEMNAFVSGPPVGVPFSQLKSFLGLTTRQQEEFDKTQAPGIPTDSTGNYETDELAYWITTTRYQMITNDIKNARIAVKADQDTKYPEVQKVIATLGELKIFNFSFITDSKAAPKGTALYTEQQEAKAAGTAEQQ